MNTYPRIPNQPDTEQLAFGGDRDRLIAALKTSGVLGEPAVLKRMEDLFARLNKPGDVLEELRRDSASDDHFSAALSYTLDIADLVGGNVRLMGPLQQLYADGKARQASDLATFDAGRWMEILYQGEGGKAITAFPEEDLSHPKLALALKDYASTLANAVADAFPMEVIRDRVARAAGASRGATPGDSGLDAFFKANPGFTFSSGPAHHFLKANPGALKGLPHPGRVVADLKVMKRLYSITPRYQEIRALLDAGLTSASRIAGIGRNAFVEDNAVRLGSAARAGEIHASAAKLTSTVNVFLLGNRAALKVLPSAVNHDEDPLLVPDWADLFGSLELCDCEDCRSVLSPAAYLVDLLHFLRQHNLSGVAGVKDAATYLFARRPDIAYIELTCANTNTALPYIDLVNEILENQVAPGFNWNPPVSPAVQATVQTTRTAAELLAEPEHVNAPAYASLVSRPYPWTLPFDLWTEMTRSYLGLLSVKRYTVMETFFPAPWPAALGDLEIAAEYLGMTPSEHAIVAGTAPFQPWEYWGFGAVHPTWVDDQKNLRTFLRNSGLSYEDTLALLLTRFVNPTAKLTILIDGACDLDKATIPWTGAADLDRAHRFVVLWRRLRWTMAEVDQAIRALGGGLLNNSFLLKLSHVRRLQVRWDPPLPALLSWWANLDTGPGLGKDRSFYEETFQNRAVVGDPTPFDLNPAATELNVIGTLNSPAIIPAILAATGLSALDFALLTDSSAAASLLQLPAADIGDNLLNLANLSHLFRVASLSRTLSMPTPEVLALRAITGIDPFNGANTADTIRFAEIAGRLSDAGQSVAQLDYLLRHNNLGAGDLPPSEEVVAAVLDSLRSALQRVLAGMPVDPTFDPTGAIARQRLENEIGHSLGDTIKLETGLVLRILGALLTVPSAPAQPATEAFVSLSFVNSSGPLTAAAFPDLFALFQRLKKIALWAGDWVSARQVEWLIDFGKADGWLDLNALPITPQTSATGPFEAWQRFDDVLRLNAALPSGEAALTEFFGAVDDGITPQATILDRLSDRFGWNRNDLGFLAGGSGFAFTFRSDFQTGVAPLRLKAACDLLRLIGVPADQAFSWKTAAASQSVAIAIVQAVKARYQAPDWPPIARVARDYLRERQRASLVAAVLFPGGGVAAPWRDTNDLFDEFLVDVEMSPCQLTSRIKQATGSVQLFIQRCMLHLETSVIPTEGQRQDWAQEWDWMKYFGVWEANRKIFLYPENWVLPELRDDKTPFFTDLENELLQTDITDESVETAYLHYLQKLDDVSHLEILGLYQETVDAPTLRYGSTGAAVADLQARLNDAGATPILVEDGLFGIATYSAVLVFQKQHGLSVDGVVGPLTWAALLTPTVNDDAIHVVGRTRGKPNIYYTRKQLRSGLKYWTPWERVDPDIDATQVAPLVWHGRPYLFWPIFTELDSPDHDPKRRTWQVRLAWTEYRNNQWQARKLTSDHPSTRVKVIDQDTTKAASTANQELTGVDIGNGSVHHLLKSQIVGDELLVGTGGDMRANNVQPTGTVGTWFRFGSCARPPRFDPDYQVDVVTKNTSTQDPLRPTGTDQYGTTFRVLAAGGPLFLPTFFFGNTSGAMTLGRTSGTAYIITSHQDPSFTGLRSFFVWDSKRTFFVSPWSGIQFTRAIGSTGGIVARNGYVFESHYHPYTCDFIKRLNRGGLDALLQRSVQVQLKLDYFAGPAPDGYAPTLGVIQPYPVDDVTFSSSGAYSLYNWELFFHIPLMIASRLMTNQNFDKAQRWFHYIFDPLDTSLFPSPARYWRTRPFFEEASSKPIADLMRILATPDAALSGADLTLKDDLRTQIQQWQKDPFNPHLIARMRISAYQKTTVMSYLDNLIAWADQIFARDTIESVNEATQLYILAARLLGPRPEKASAPVVPAVQTFHSLETAGLDDFSNALVQGEDVLADMGLGAGVPLPPTPPALRTLAFCVPGNDKLLGYWDTLNDRLFKIRHCMNLQGTVRDLPLFDPPIDPALLVRAAAAGLDIGAVLNELSAPAPLYRFGVMVERAIQFCADVRGLGAALLSALVARDTEGLALLHADQEIAMLTEITDVRKSQVEEASDLVSAQLKALDLATRRRDYYTNIKKTSEGEVAALIQTGTAVLLDGTAAVLDFVGSGAATTGDKSVGNVGPYTVSVITQSGGASQSKWSTGLRTLAGILNQTAAMTATIAGYERRADEWSLQKDLAGIEIDQINQQIAAAQVRRAVAEKELTNHQSQIDRATEVRSFVISKFSNGERYDWMVGQLSALYFQGYQLACEISRKAERAWNAELGVEDTTFIQFGYWDTLQKGLLAGERLNHDLKRMQSAYLDRAAREFEIRKHISLVSLDPMALVKLRQNGECFIEIPETVFDIDYPGHYLRRIKSLSLTLPCVTGPYTGVSATLTLLKSSIRKDNTLRAGKHQRDTSVSDPRFRDLTTPVQSIAASSGLSDSGLFELNFRDERYLPFELAGAISSWRLELSPIAQFDYQTISDVVLHMSLTAREGGPLKAAATSELNAELNAMALADARKGRAILFSLKHRFPAEWFRLLTVPEPVTGDHVQSFSLNVDLFPFYLRGEKVKIAQIHILALQKATALVVFDTFVTPPGAVPDNVKDKISLVPDVTVQPALHGARSWLPGQEPGLGDWTMRIRAADFASINNGVSDLLILLEYAV